MKKLCEELPRELATDFRDCWLEYEANNTREAKFVKAIDAIDPIMQAYHQPTAWRKFGFTEKIIREKKEHHIKEFPEIYSFFNELIDNLNERNIIPK